MVVAHTNCRMAAGDEESVPRRDRGRRAAPTRAASRFEMTADQEATLRADVQRIRSFPYLAGLQVGGFVYDVDTGRVAHVC